MLGDIPDYIVRVKYATAVRNLHIFGAFVKIGFLMLIVFVTQITSGNDDKISKLSTVYPLSLSPSSASK